MINQAYERFLAESLEEEKKEFYNLFITEDQKEGMRAFAEKRKADSLQYANFTTDTKDYTYQDTPNEVLLNNGMKVTIVKLTRFPIPRGPV